MSWKQNFNSLQLCRGKGNQGSELQEIVLEMKAGWVTKSCLERRPWIAKNP
jgi:hypothetical protein